MISLMHNHGFTFKRTDIWREGEWIDLWSVVHLLSGISTGLGFYYLQLDPYGATALAFISFVAYEMWEQLAKIEETPANRFMDVVVGMVGFLPAFFYIGPHISDILYVRVFAAVFGVNILLSLIGWRASRKAAELEKRMRARYMAERAQLIERREQLLHKLRR